MYIHDPTIYVISESDRPMTNRLVGRDSPRGCNGVLGIKQAVVATEGLSEKLTTISPVTFPAFAS
jgi:hypothetical protein